MPSIKENDEINHLFLPDIPPIYLDDYNKFKIKIKNAFPNYRKVILEAYINTIKENDIEAIKYKSVLSILYDLLNQGYILSFDENNDVNLNLLNEEAESKEFVRYNMSFEKKVQLDSPSVKRFIAKMEKNKMFNNQNISIKNLIGSSLEIINKCNNGIEAVEPYIQMADDTCDVHTGYKLKDIWRYFRYTWSIPYKNTPGRNIYYLVRDKGQQFHPIIGIFALGNCILNLTVRDNQLGWTIDAINKNLQRKQEITNCLCKIKGQDFIYNQETIKYIESEEEYEKRITKYSQDIYQALLKSVDKSIEEIYKEDLINDIDFNNVTQEDIGKLRKKAEYYKSQLLDTKHLDTKNISYVADAKLPLFCKKRCLELAKLFEAKLIFKKYEEENPCNTLKNILKCDDGKKAITTALVSIRKTKIGSNMMEIIVCGAIPPYNEILGGKLVSILACSPQVILDYSNKYKIQISEIASRMAGREIVRDSSLVFLGTTSLYTKCSSQYNRINVKIDNDSYLKYQKVGITEGFGTLFFSKRTTDLLTKMLILLEGGRKINNVFGEGTSPRFRLLTTGFNKLGLKNDVFLKHNSPRIVYSIPLITNLTDYLIGIDEEPKYLFDKKEAIEITNKYIDFWKSRWLNMRLNNEDVKYKLEVFDVEKVLVSNID